LEAREVSGDLGGAVHQVPAVVRVADQVVESMSLIQSGIQPGG
jgi:hypothetical protein